LQNSLSGETASPSDGGSEEIYCPIADTLPEDFAQAQALLPAATGEDSMESALRMGEADDVRCREEHRRVARLDCVEDGRSFDPDQFEKGVVVRKRQPAQTGVACPKTLARQPRFWPLTTPALCTAPP
jgi:hypothetical protein